MWFHELISLVEIHRPRRAERHGYKYAGSNKLKEYAGSKFHLIDLATGGAVFTGPITKRKDKTSRESAIDKYGPNWNYTNAYVWQCDWQNGCGYIGIGRLPAWPEGQLF